MWAQSADPRKKPRPAARPWTSYAACMSDPNAPDGVNESSPDARPFSPVCLSCGFPRKGLGNSITTCPECGAKWVRVSERHAWASETRWGLGSIALSVAAALAIVAPRTSALAMLRAGEFVCMICDWLLVVPGLFFYLGLRALSRAAPDVPSTTWSARLSLIVAILLLAHASGAMAIPLENLSNLLGSNEPLVAAHLLQAVFMVLLSVAAASAMRVVGSVLTTIGSLRDAGRLRTLARPAMIFAIVLGCLSILGEELSLINDRWPKGPFTWWTFSQGLIASIGAWAAFTLAGMGLMILAGASVAYRWVRFYDSKARA